MWVTDQNNYWAAEDNAIDHQIEAASGQSRVYADKQLVVTRTCEPHGLVFSGEIDVTNCHAVAESLRTTFVGSDDLHLDLTGLIFCDISGIRAFVDAAAQRSDRRLLVHGLPEALQTVMKVTGWADLPSLILCNCTGWTA